MFPSAFADEVVAKYSSVGDTLLDPFAGRGTALFSAVSAGRDAIGFEINPVGWIYCRTKLSPAPKDAVAARIAEIEALSPQFKACADALPLFFQRWYAPQVRSFLMAARSLLDWRTDDIGRTAMAFMLVIYTASSPTPFRTRCARPKPCPLNMRSTGGRRTARNHHRSIRASFCSKSWNGG
jgi:hypothetical protein